MTALEKLLKELKEKADAATPGPWDVYFATGEQPAIITFNEIDGKFREYKEMVIPIFLKTKEDFANYEFCAEANPDTIKKLIAVIRRQQECLQYCLGPTRDLKDFQIKEALEDCEKIVRGDE